METLKKYKSSTISNTKFINSESLYLRFIDARSVLKKIHDQINFSFVNDLCDDVYHEGGQHAFLPELVFRVTFIQYFKGGLSDNEVVRQCRTNMEYRYFCNLAIDDDLFDDCKLSRFRTDLGAERFKQIFGMILKKIKSAGLVSNEDVQYLDSFLFLADVKMVSINALLSKSIAHTLDDLEMIDAEIVEDMKKRDFELSEEQQKQRFVFLVKKAHKMLALAKKHKMESKKSVEILGRIVKERSEILEDESVRKKDSSEEKDKIMSVSDPDVRMMGKQNKPIAPTYKSHVAMNKDGFITYTDVTHSTVYDGHHARETICALKSEGFSVPAAVGDTHYGDMDLREDMQKEGTQIIAPYRKNQVMNSCLKEDIMIEAWAYNHTLEYKNHLRVRSHIEPKQGELINHHGMKRARLRGIEKVRIQNLMAAITTNCKLFVAS